MVIKREFSVGGVVFKKLKIKNKKLKIVFLLGKHSGYHKWVLPKGLVEEGERSWQTAIRETEEEMGVKTRPVIEKPIHVEKYVYYADYKPQPKISNSKFLISNQIPSSKFKGSKQSNNGTMEQFNNSRSSRRVLKYQEEGGSKVKVFKTVTFYLLEYVSGDPKEHGWEMSEAGWFAYDEALNIMSFAGEKEALKKAYRIISS